MGAVMSDGREEREEQERRRQQEEREAVKTGLTATRMTSRFRSVRTPEGRPSLAGY